MRMPTGKMAPLIGLAAGVLALAVLAAVIYVTIDAVMTGKDFPLTAGKEPREAARYWSIKVFPREQGHTRQVAEWAVREHPGFSRADAGWLESEIRRRSEWANEVNWSFRELGPLPGYEDQREAVIAVISVDLPSAPEGKRAFTARITLPFRVVATRHNIISAEPVFSQASVHTWGQGSW